MKPKLLDEVIPPHKGTDGAARTTVGTIETASTVSAVEYNMLKPQHVVNTILMLPTTEAMWTIHRCSLIQLATALTPVCLSVSQRRK